MERLVEIIWVFLVLSLGYTTVIDASKAIRALRTRSPLSKGWYLRGALLSVLGILYFYHQLVLSFSWWNLTMMLALLFMGAHNFVCALRGQKAIKARFTSRQRKDLHLRRVRCALEQLHLDFNREAYDIAHQNWDHIWLTLRHIEPEEVEEIKKRVGADRLQQAINATWAWVKMGAIHSSVIEERLKEIEHILGFPDVNIAI